MTPQPTPPHRGRRQMAEEYPYYVDLTPKQREKLVRYLGQSWVRGPITIQQREDKALLVSCPDENAQWRIGVRGGWAGGW
jgi:hypothetical protein